MTAALGGSNLESVLLTGSYKRPLHSATFHTLPKLSFPYTSPAHQTIHRVKVSFPSSSPLSDVNLVQNVTGASTKVCGAIPTE